MTVPAEDRFCEVQASGNIELYFYDELTPPERELVDRHLALCRHCRTALDELAVIRTALAERPVVEAPRLGDWSAFMARLDTEVSSFDSVQSDSLRTGRFDSPQKSFETGPEVLEARSWVPYLAMAALLALVVTGVFLASRWRQSVQPSAAPILAETSGPVSPAPSTAASNASLASLSEQHFERSKLVVLGLATKDARQAGPEDWIYERQLASTLLSDTRLYRLAAEDQGMVRVARVMRDLELVLLQTSLSEDTEPAALAQIQRLIQKRDLLGRMNVVNTTGL